MDRWIDNIRSVVMAAIEVYVVGTKCHSAANFVGAVPNHLIGKKTLWMNA